MWLFNCSPFLKRVFKPLSLGSMIASGSAVISMMLVIVADVIFRGVFNISLQGSIEIVRVLLVIAVYGGMAYTVFAKAHIRVDILVDKLSKPVRLSLISAGNLLAIGVLVIISWKSFVEAQMLWGEHANSGSLKIPLAPFAFATGIFMALFVFAVLVDFLETLAEAVRSNTRSLHFLGPAIAASAVLFMFSMQPAIIPIKLGHGMTGMFCVLLLFALIFFGVHIGAAMAYITLLGMSYLIHPDAGRSLLSMTSQSVASNYIWSVIPLFAFLGLIAGSLGFSKDIYSTAYKWMGSLPGGLASATVTGCGAFAAIVGDSTSGVVTFSSIAYPEMKARGYDVKLMTGCICSGATLGILIPPSMGFVVYGILTEQSIGKLFMAGLLPGILEASALVLFIYFLCRRKPHLGPPGPTFSLKEKVISLRYAWHVLILFLLVIGGIYVGIFTPYEAAAVGVFSALLMGAVTGRLKFQNFTNGVIQASKMTAFLMFIFIYANALGQFLALTQVPVVLSNFVTGLEIPRYGTLIAIMILYVMLGCVMNVLPAMIITLPILFPTVIELGFNPIWFGVLLTITLEIGLLTPPIGMNVFAMSGIITDVPMYTIFRSVLPFWLVMLFVLFILILFPQISLFLPNLM